LGWATELASLQESPQDPEILVIVILGVLGLTEGEEAVVGRQFEKVG
jgi:hypothetical protein